jgi:hypothetical protein
MTPEQRRFAAKVLGRSALRNLAGKVARDIASAKSSGVFLAAPGDRFTFNHPRIAAMTDAELAAFVADFGATPQELEAAMTRAQMYTEDPDRPMFPAVTLDPARPWMLALEMQFAALRNACITRDAPGEIDDEPPPQGLREACAVAASILPRCEAFAWSHDTAAAVLLASRSVPRASVLSASTLPARACWWYFTEPLPLLARPELEIDLGDEIGTIDTRHLAAISCAATDDGYISVICYRPLPNRGPLATTTFFAREGITVEEFASDIAHVDVREGTRRGAVEVAQFVAAACAWLQQRIAIWSSARVERHRRKQIGREHRVPEPLDVKVVELRRLESQPRTPGLGEHVEWSCRWVVNGHWRNQPYKDSRKLIFIMPFMKGPADRPLKVPTHTVYAVDR